eukprot:7096952-Lingulodinium_polyedra.AAC.1
MARGIWEPKANEELAARARALTARVESRRVIKWTHVYGHTGEHDNELADVAAGRGADGVVSSDSRRWAQPREGPQGGGVQEEELDQCRKCGGMFPESTIKWHFRRCAAEVWAIPQGRDKCRKCGELLPFGRRPFHEP